MSVAFLSLSSRDPAPWREWPHKGAALHGLCLQFHESSTTNSAQFLRVPLCGWQPLPPWKQHAHAAPLLKPCRAQLRTASQKSWRYSKNLSNLMRLNSSFVPHVLSVLVCLCLVAASSTTGPEAIGSERDSLLLPSKNPSSWSIEEVMQFVRDADPTALAPHAELFRKHVS